MRAARWLVATTALALMGAACGDDDVEVTTQTGQGATVTDLTTAATDSTSSAADPSDPASSEPGTGSSDTASPGEPEPELDAQIAVADDAVEITYQLTNSGAEPVIVTGAIATRGGSAPDPGAAYVTATDDGVVVVSQASFRVPDGMNVDAPARIYGTLVEPGEAVEGALSVPRPFEPAHPYLPTDELAAEFPDDPSAVRFCLGVYPTLRATESAPTVEADDRVRLELSMGDLGAGGTCSPDVPIE